MQASQPVVFTTGARHLSNPDSIALVWDDDVVAIATVQDIYARTT